MSEPAIENLYTEGRTFPPPEAFAAQANINDPSVYDTADEDWQGWWEQHARQLRWMRDWDTTLEWTPPHAKWFLGGQLNVADNCLDRHIEAGLGERPAFHWIGEPGDTRTLTYNDLCDQVCAFANALKNLGVRKGDRVNIYLPMIPELPIAMLACARIGAIHSVVFAGFSSQALVDRIDDADSKVLITADGAYRKGAVVPLKEAADAAMGATDRVETCVVVRRTGEDVSWTEGRDHWYHEVTAGCDTHCEPEPMDAEDVLYILYTSGTTGKPKGIVHTTGGYLTQVAATTKLVFDLEPDTDVYWCAADIGWVTGHSYIVYGPLANGATSLLYEGAPDHPGKDRFWEIIETYRATILYTAPTAIRAFMKWGEQYPDRHDLSSLRLLGTVGRNVGRSLNGWSR